MPGEDRERPGAATVVVVLGVLLALGFYVTTLRRNPADDAATALPSRTETTVVGATPEALVLRDPAGIATNAPTERKSVGPPNAASLLVRLSATRTPLEPLQLTLHDALERMQPARRLTSSSTEWEALAAGRYTLEVSGPGWKPVRRVLELHAGDNEELVAIEPRTFLRGQVLDAFTGAPVPAYRVRLEHELEGNLTLAHRTVEVEDPEGRFDLGGLPEDGLRLRLCASAEGYLDASSEWLPVAPQIEGLVLLLPDEAAHLARVRGTVRYPEGRGQDAAGDVQLLVVHPETDPALATVAGGRLQVPERYELGLDRDESVRAHTESRDSWRPRKGAPGARALARGTTYELALRAEGPACVLAHSAFGVAKSEPFYLVPGEEVVVPPILLAPGAGGSLTGRLVAGEKPQWGRILLYGQGLSRTVETDPDGSFRFTALPPGSYDVAARGAVADVDGSPADLLLATARVTLVPNEDTFLELDAGARGGASVTGLVVSPDETALRWQLALVALGSHTARGAPVAADGTFRFDGVAPGDYLLALGSVPSPRGVVALSFGFVEVERDASRWVELRPSGRVELLAPRPGDAELFTFTLVPDDSRLTALFEDQGHLGLFDEHHTARIYGLPPGRVTFACDERTLELEVPFPPGTRLERWD